MRQPDCTFLSRRASPTDAQDGAVDIGNMFLSYVHPIMPSGKASPWLMPSFKARLLYSFRVALSIGLASVWVLNPTTHDLFIPGLLVPIAAVSRLGTAVFISMIFF